MVELVAAMALLAVGILAAGTVFASSTRFSSASEARQAMAHRAQEEVERLQSLSYGTLAHATLPAAGAADAEDPLHWFTPATGTYQWDRSATGAASAEPLVQDAAGQVAVGPTAWSDGRLSGRLYDFVTWVHDARCGTTCPAGQNYKRVTVALALDSGGPAVAPVYLTSIVSDPNAVPPGRVVNGNANPLADPTISCRDASGATVSCTASVGSTNVNQWYLTDSPASGGYSSPTGDHTAHPTVAPIGICTVVTLTGCPVPDLLTSDPPTSTDPLNPPQLPVYSTDVGTVPGRVLKRDVSCGSTPTADNSKGEMWTTAPLSSATSLTGSGGMTLYSRTAGGGDASVTICVGIYAVASIANLVAVPPVRLGVVAYTVARWPSAYTPVSFSFDFLGAGTVAVAAGQRIGVRVWAAASAGDDVALGYDNPSYASVLQLNSQ